MPNRADVEREITALTRTGQDVVRRKYLRALHAHTKRDTIVYASAFSPNKGQGVPSFLLSITTDDIQGFMATVHGKKNDCLDLILHSPGGSLEAAEQIVNYLRLKYKHIRAIVPQNAMSAATMIACACDEIVMGKQSAIGPIDPQISFPTQNGQFTAPAQALLDDFEKAKSEVVGNPLVAPLWVSKMKDYPPGIFNMCANTIALAKTKVAEWLASRMLASDENRSEKAAAIASWLGDARTHKTHGHPISFGEALERGLKVVPLEADQVFQDRALTVFHAVAVTFRITPCVKLIENHRGKGFYSLGG